MPRTPRNDNKRLAVIILAIFICAAGLIFFSPYGIKKAIKNRKQLRTITAENIALEGKNKELRQEIDRLKKDPVYLEEVARKEHGMVKKSDLVFEFKKGK